MSYSTWGNFGSRFTITHIVNVESFHCLLHFQLAVSKYFFHEGPDLRNQSGLKVPQQRAGMSSLSHISGSPSHHSGIVCLWQRYIDKYLQYRKNLNSRTVCYVVNNSLHWKGGEKHCENTAPFPF
ncbi:hypothetical protein L873DRAFT_706231 [Choiromyces venosus 120613-1]|uniref:Uncharacterized protein n=1 Tax=Choiromyces venosus 120613-1 TaxID=1336337 RepID=A0A3N4IW59_9PEZI|nr:hypothetical protein L873DRAFT_706231 [Choiromyces venosus 120613-1]